MMNAYASPAVSAETEDHTDPAFRIIGPYGKVAIATMTVLMVVMGGVVTYQILLSRGRSAIYYAPVAGSMMGSLSPFINLLIASRQSRLIRRNPIVRSGQALVAGIAYQSRFSPMADHLFLTRTELVCFHRGGGWASGTEQRIRLADISEVSRPRRFGIRQMAIEVRLRSGGTRRWTVAQPGEWLKAISYELPAAG